MTALFVELITVTLFVGVTLLWWTGPMWGH